MSQLPLDESDVGRRIDRVLAHRLGLSRRAVWQLLDEGRVQLGRRTLTSRHKGHPLPAGVTLTVSTFVSPQDRRAMANPQLPLHLAAGGEGWLIADKPTGMPVHPLQSGETMTLLNAVIARYPTIQGVGEGGLRSGVVHRLDLETSGLVLFALTETRWQSFRHAFSEHRVTKRYLALVHGHLPPSGRETMDLAVTQHRPARVRVVKAGAHSQSRRCSLAWKTRDTLPTATLVEVDLHTGFLHQIRVMFASLGHPVVGDPIYGCDSDRHSASRLMLHAHSLEMDEHIRATADLPDTFQETIHQHRQGAGGK